MDMLHESRFVLLAAKAMDIQQVVLACHARVQILSNHWQATKSTNQDL
jgi:hypothetical protein